MTARRLVLADNDPDALELILMDLRFEGHDVVGSAADGAEALRLCSELRPDVLVVDYRMPPGLNGAEVAERARAAQPALTVVVFTNYDIPEVERAVRRAGAKLVRKGDLDGLRAAVNVPPSGPGPSVGGR